MAKIDKSWKVSLLLLKDSVAAFSDALKTNSKLVKHELDGAVPYTASLYLGKSEPRAPRWLEFLSPMLNGKSPKLSGSAFSAVLFIEAAGRKFAATFGYGRNDLRPECFESDFGLKATLNLVDPARLRSLDIRAFEDLVVSTRTQTSRSTELGSFGLDVSRDLLRSVVGEPSDKTFATRLAGSDALVLTSPVTAKGLDKKCELALKAYNDIKYQTHFDWIDQLSEVKSPVLIAELDNLLLDALKNKQIEKVHLAPAEPVDWQEVAEFRIAGAGRTSFIDLSIEGYLDALGNNLPLLSAEKLKRYLISVRWQNSEHAMAKWTVYNSLAWETDHNNKFYVLVDGRWFQVEAKFAKRIRDYVGKITPPSISLPTSTSGESEATYNANAAANSKDLFLFDRKLVKPEDSASEIEFCDLFSKEKHFIHVKRKTRSATLSHLFAQGMVAAQAFLQDEKVRKKAKDIIRADCPSGGFLSLLPDSRPTPSEFEVVYAIIAKPQKKWPKSLPFFSQLNLMQHAKSLTGMGFRVSLLLIEET